MTKEKLGKRQVTKARRRCHLIRFFLELKQTELFQVEKV